MESRLVYCVICIDGDEQNLVHIFSTQERAKSFCERDDRSHILYDYVIDHPERMERSAKAVN